MPVKTWLQKLTDESSLWFNAIKAEDAGDPIKAAEYYLQDIIVCLKENALIRAALSCSCAANCLAMTSNGSEARKLYREAAQMYKENADMTIGNSIRESLWSLQESYENFIFAGEAGSAKSVHDVYVSLAARISPFSGIEEALQTSGFRKLAAENSINPNRATNGQAIKLSNGIIAKMKELMECRNPLPDIYSKNSAGITPESIGRPVGKILNEKRLVS